MKQVFVHLYSLVASEEYMLYVNVKKGHISLSGS